MDQGASVEVMFEHCFENLSPAIRLRLRGTLMDLVGFARSVVKPLSKIELEVVFDDRGLFRTVMINFTVVRAPSPYNVIFRRTGLRSLRAVSLTIHSMVKFPNPRGIATLVTRSAIIFECRRVDLTEHTLANPTYPDQLATIGGNLSKQCKNQLRMLLKKSMDVFAWEPADMMGIPRRIIEHSLNVNPSVEPVAQTRRVLASDRTQVVSKEVEEWVNAGIVRPVRYPTWISNPVLVKKSDGSWMMCIDFKNINSACPKDYYPLPDIDEKIESVVGFRYKCFLDAYKGYHQVQMAQDDEEKTAFYTDQGTYCYTKMPFGLKNAGATYQRLVDTAFQSQIGRNLEAYVDDMVIKSNDEKVLIEDIQQEMEKGGEVELEDSLKRSDNIPVRVVSAPLPHLGSATSGFAGKPGAKDVRCCLDPLDTLARSTLARDSEYDQIPEDDFATASRGEEIDLTFFPLSPGPYVIPYSFDGESYPPFTKQQWDGPHLPENNILCKETFRDPNVFRKALDHTITPVELRRTESLLPLDLLNRVNVLSALLVSHGMELNTRYTNLVKSMAHTKEKLKHKSGYVKELRSEVTTLDKKLEGALKDYSALDQENKELRS
ncbi:reverse transcriptase domain-containing protein [Tanacetum coccineum]